MDRASRIQSADYRVETQTLAAPHNAVKAEALSVYAGARRLLDETELTLAERCCSGQNKKSAHGFTYGLVGPNGCGKSSLLTLLASRRLPVPASWDVFLVSQHLVDTGRRACATQNECLIEEVLRVDERRRELLASQTALEAQIRAAAESDNSATCEDVDMEDLAGRLAAIQAGLRHWDGADREVKEILVALGFRREIGNDASCSTPALDTPLHKLSGGWRMKVELAKALWLKPKLLLLDEPNNHLDFRALHWLQEEIQKYSHTVVVVSHDVTFLHSVCDEILWIDKQRIESMPKEMVTQEDLVRMQRKKPLAFKFCVPASDDLSNHGISLHNVEFSYTGSGGAVKTADPALRLRASKDVRISGSSRCVLLGKNGSGKSTFLNLCCGKLEPTSGAVDRTQGLKIGYYSQLSEELDAFADDSAAAYLVKTCPGALVGHMGSSRVSRLISALEARKEHEQRADEGGRSTVDKAALKAARTIALNEKRMLEVARGVLSNFGFEGELATSVPIKHLSGGQKACLKFGKLSLEPAHILLLDEPTNHLDAEASEALIRALAEFRGGIVAVTHDEHLVYRLIHCNWTTSELLICKHGFVDRKESVGASCLSALKQELQRAEEEDDEAKHHTHEGPKGRAGKQAQKALVAAASQATPADERVPAAKISSAPPPWLLSRRRARPAKDGMKSPTPDVLDSMWPESTHQQDTATHAIYERIPEFSQTSAECKAVYDAAADESPDIPRPQSLDERAWDTTSAVTLDALTATDHSCAAADSSTKSRELSGLKGRHSRARKDLINLNKAVAHWLQKEEVGDLSPAQVVERIKESTIARHLAHAHGENYDENQFLASVLDRARQKLNASA